MKKWNEKAKITRPTLKDPKNKWEYNNVWNELFPDPSLNAIKFFFKKKKRKEKALY